MKKCINEMKLSFSAVSENEAFSRACVSSFTALLDPYISELAELKTAVSEAVTNCIVHAYRGQQHGTVWIHMRLYSDRRVYIKIRDKGCGIDDIDRAMQPLFTTAPEEERAGLGFAVMESFTDRLRVRSSRQRGTTVVMEKTLSEKEKDGYTDLQDTAAGGRELRAGTSLC